MLQDQLAYFFRDVHRNAANAVGKSVRLISGLNFDVLDVCKLDPSLFRYDGNGLRGCGKTLSPPCHKCCHASSKKISDNMGGTLCVDMDKFPLKLAANLKYFYFKINFNVNNLCHLLENALRFIVFRSMNITPF